MTPKRTKTTNGAHPTTSKSVEKPKNSLHQLKKTKSVDSAKERITTSLPTNIPSWVSSQLLQAMKIPALVIKQSELWTAIRDRYPKVNETLINTLTTGKFQAVGGCYNDEVQVFDCDVDSAFVLNFARLTLLPSAKHHFLILPNQSIPRLTDVTLEHLPLLQSMHQAAEELALSFAPSDFRIGYHSVPSMLQLHLHVISTDFCSPCLKTKKHWNSFNTDFFIPSNVFMQMVQQGDHLKIPHDPKYGLLLKQELRCHKCPDSFRTMPQLKTHLKTHVGTEMESISST